VKGRRPLQWARPQQSARGNCLFPKQQSPPAALQVSGGCGCQRACRGLNRKTDPGSLSTQPKFLQLLLGRGDSLPPLGKFAQAQHEAAPVCDRRKKNPNHLSCENGEGGLIEGLPAIWRGSAGATGRRSEGPRGQPWPWLHLGSKSVAGQKILFSE